MTCRGGRELWSRPSTRPGHGRAAGQVDDHVVHRGERVAGGLERGPQGRGVRGRAAELLDHDGPRLCVPQHEVAPSGVAGVDTREAGLARVEGPQLRGIAGATSANADSVQAQVRRGRVVRLEVQPRAGANARYLALGHGHGEVGL